MALWACLRLALRAKEWSCNHDILELPMAALTRRSLEDVFGENGRLKKVSRSGYLQLRELSFVTFVVTKKQASQKHLLIGSYCYL